MIKTKLNIDAEKYPLLSQFAEEKGTHDTPKVQNREAELSDLKANLARPIVSNTLLLAGPGTGKTALVEWYTVSDTAEDEHVLELDVQAMSEKGEDQFTANLKKSMDEVMALQKDTNIRLIIFIDEFHVVAIKGGTDAIKPILARSGQLGIRFVGATTDEEYFDYIKPNQALDQRLQPLKLSEPSNADMLPILQNTVMFHAPELKSLFTDRILKRIIEYGKYQPAMFQPRKSILFVDALIGKYRGLGIKPSTSVINEHLYSITGVKADWKTDIDQVVKKLEAKVKGQDDAIARMKDSLNVSVAGLQDPSKPMASFLFAGTTGTGKTELTRTLASALFGTERSMQRFDMSEYQTQDSVQVFQDRITRGLTQQPYTILLFDELEKAHSGVRNLLLQLLDDGRMSDRYGRQISGLNSYIIMTTNLGATVLKDIADNEGDVNEYKKLLFSELAVTLKPEFLGRLTEIVPFKPLGNQTLTQIADLRIKELSNRIYRKFGVIIKLSSQTIDIPDGYETRNFTVNKVLAYIVADKVVRNANSGGGRAVARRIESEVASQIATFLNKTPHVHKTYDYLTLSIHGKMVIEDAFDKNGSAGIKVTPHKRI